MTPGTIDPHADVYLMDLDALYEELDRLSDRRAAVKARIHDIETGADEWAAYRCCVTGERRGL